MQTRVYSYDSEIWSASQQKWRYVCVEIQEN